MALIGRPLRHFLTLLDLSPDEAQALLQRAAELKRPVCDGERFDLLKNRTLGMIFEKSSTRTRVSFEVGMTQLGGHALFLSSQDTQLGRIHVGMTHVVTVANPGDRPPSDTTPVFLVS